MKLHTKIFIGLIAGAAAGSLLTLGGLTGVTPYIKPVGDVFIKLLKMVTIPLIAVSIMGAVAGFSDLKKLGRVGLKGIGFFLISTVLAVSVGLGAATLFRPGKGIDESKKAALLADIQKNPDWQRQMSRQEQDPRRSPADFLLALIPANPFNALAEGDMLAVITFSLLFGLAVSRIPASGKDLINRLFDAGNEALVTLVKMVMKLAPYAVFTLIAAVITQFGFHFLLALLEYAALTVGTMAFFLAVYYGLTISSLARFNPLQFFSAMRSVALLAFSTSSSNATLPENLIDCQQKLGIRREIAAFILPLGATVNMTGTAIYQGVSVMFIAQVFGIGLTLHQVLMIVLTATLAAVGTAGIPGIGIVTLAMVLGAVGIPVEGIGLIIGVERILDMCRTVLNVLGDSAAALIVHRSEERRQRKTGET